MAAFYNFDSFLIIKTCVLELQIHRTFFFFNIFEEFYLSFSQILRLFGLMVQLSRFPWLLLCRALYSYYYFEWNAGPVKENKS